MRFILLLLILLPSLVAEEYPYADLLAREFWRAIVSGDRNRIASTLDHSFEFNLCGKHRSANKERFLASVQMEYAKAVFVPLKQIPTWYEYTVHYELFLYYPFAMTAFDMVMEKSPSGPSYLISRIDQTGCEHINPIMKKRGLPVIEL